MNVTIKDNFARSRVSDADLRAFAERIGTAIGATEVIVETRPALTLDDFEVWVTVQIGDRWQLAGWLISEGGDTPRVDETLADRIAKGIQDYRAHSAAA